MIDSCKVTRMHCRVQVLLEHFFGYENVGVITQKHHYIAITRKFGILTVIVEDYIGERHVQLHEFIELSRNILRSEYENAI